MYYQLVSQSIETLEHFIYFSLVYFLVCLCIYHLVTRKRRGDASTNGSQEQQQQQQNGRISRALAKLKNNLPRNLQSRVLFVISHPDDECMFFGPLILTLTQRKDAQIHVLCLSNGNYDNKCQERRDELWRSCTKLGIPASNIILMSVTNMPDDPTVEWKHDEVAHIIINTVWSLDIQAIITFDQNGVSSHPNHKAAYYGATALCFANLLPRTCRFYTLDSVNIVRKYISIFDLILTAVASSNWCILSPHEASIIRSAMKEHRSQMEWFRWLYIHFSRYIYINSIREVSNADIEWES